MRFQPRLLPTLIAFALISLGIAAGLWQQGRAAQKALIKTAVETQAAQPAKPLHRLPFDAGALRWHKVDARGEWLGQATVFLDNRIHQGMPGYHVITPLKLEDGRVVLVNRGWVRAGRSRAELPALSTPAGEVRLIGQVRLPLQNAFALGTIASPDQKVWQQLRLDELSKSLGLPLAPFVVFQQSDAPDGLQRDWEAPDYGIDMHRGYAFQWFSLAALSFVFFLIVSFRFSRDAK